MSQEIKYSEDSRILIRTFRGRVEFRNVLASWVELVRENKLDPPLIGVLNDFTYADLIMDRNELGILMDFFTTHKSIFSRITLAVVMIRPENIVLPVIASQNFPDFRIQAFSTIPAAEDWIRINA